VYDSNTESFPVEKPGFELLKKELSCIIFENFGSHFIENKLLILRTRNSGVELDQSLHLHLDT
jgi:hypothetical protein